MPLEEIIVGREPDDIKKFGRKGCVFLGKHIVGSGFESHLTNPVYMDVSRPHIILIAGKRGSGKCLEENTLITLDDGSMIPIKELENNKNRVLSLNNRLKIIKAEKNGFFTRTVNKIIHVKLKSGREIKLTPEHPLLTIHGWKQVNELSIGSRIAVPRRLEVFGNESIGVSKINLIVYLLSEGYMGNGPILSNRKKESIRKWLKEIGIYGRSFKDKFIPEIIFKLKRNELALFLNRLFTCNGSIYKERKVDGCEWKISYSSSSKKLIHQLQHLLLRFGVMSMLRDKKTISNGMISHTFELVINGENVRTFIKEIGFNGYKNGLQEISFKETNQYPQAMTKTVCYGTSTYTLLEITQAEQNDLLHIWAASDICWDEIVSMELIEGIFKVYDISVPDFHNFVANDIIVHNSYSGAVIAEEMMNFPDDVRDNLSCIMFDTMDIFWSMKSPNEAGMYLLADWGLKPKAFPIQTLVPVGQRDIYEKQGIAYDDVIAIKPSELMPGDWALTFGISLFEPLGILLERVITQMKNKNEDYSIADIINTIREDKRSDEKEKMSLENRFMAAEGWGIFSQVATPIEKLLKPGAATVISVALMDWSVRNLLLGLLCRKIYYIRTAARRQEEAAAIAGESIKKTPLTWIIIDEAHNYLPAEGETAATHDLITLVTQGRQPGVSLILITQRPMKLHETAIAQSDIVIAHRLTAKPDLDALSQIMQTYALEDIRKMITDLPRTKGCAVILDDNSERLFAIQVRPRQSWHAGGTPIAIR